MQEYYVEVRTADYKEYLYRKLSDLRTREGLPIDIYEIKNGAHYLVRCVYSTVKGRREQERLTVRIYNYYFARAIAEIIFQEWEGVFVKRILKQEYSLNNNDIDEIIDKVWREVNKKDQTYLPETRKHVLVKAILEFLDGHQRFDIEGFMNFRAGLYKKEIRKQVAQAVNDFNLEQEHRGFIKLLRRFLNTQHSRYNTMHLVIKGQGEVAFFDNRGRNVNHEFLKENSIIMQEAAQEELPLNQKSSLELYEDFIISSILKCAPQRLVVHAAVEQHPDMILIMEEVFEERISFCPGCPLCRELELTT